MPAASSRDRAAVPMKTGLAGRPCGHPREAEDRQTCREGRTWCREPGRKPVKPLAAGGAKRGIALSLIGTEMEKVCLAAFIAAPSGGARQAWRCALAWTASGRRAR